MSAIYNINKGVSKPIVFKGLKAQYIGYLAVGLVLLLIIFAVLYISGASLMVIMPLVFGLAAGLFYTVTTLSHRFGEHGLMKYLASKSLPRSICFRSRKQFLSLKRGRAK